MLQNLSVQNYALIHNLDIDFQKGFSIITGETGAGKSILLGALSLILGQRADTTVLLNKSSKCVVEGTFNIGSYTFKDFFKENDLDYEDITIIRREINSQGKSRAFINDVPANLNTLRELGLKLIDIHSQHQNLNLGDHLFQLLVVDLFAGHQNLTKEYKKSHDEYKSLLYRYEELLKNAEQQKDDIDYYQFQFDELDKAKLIQGEQEELEKELKVLDNAENIKTILSGIAYHFNQDEVSMVNRLKESFSSIAKLSDTLQEAKTLAKRIESSYIELKDIALEIDALNQKIDINPDRLQYVQQRLDLIYGLQQKHRVKSIEELIQIKDSLSEKIHEITNYDALIEETQKKLEASHEKVSELAETISLNRKNVIPDLEERIMTLLHQLGMPYARFMVHIDRHPDFTPSGIDEIYFLFSANKQVEPEDIARIASGGELSRLMLSIKYLVSKHLSLPTIIFDEIDAGVSGEIADKVGNIMLEMSQYIQVINITHLPQVASKGNTHYLVYKEMTDHTTATKIKLLQQEERITEVAKMLSGEELTESAINNAKDLLNNKI